MINDKIDQNYINNVFFKVANKYDKMNDLMSAGLHRLWKTDLVNIVNPPILKNGKEYNALDLAGGTGDIAFKISDRTQGQAKIVVADINQDMIECGKNRAQKKKLNNIDFVQADACDLPFDAEKFDVITIAFGIRNIPDRHKALTEMYRTLKHGRKIVILEFTPLQTPIIKDIYQAYSNLVIPFMGKLVAGDPEPYKYLVESINKFPKPENFINEIKNAGFKNIRYKFVTSKTAAIHIGWKI